MDESAYKVAITPKLFTPEHATLVADYLKQAITLSTAAIALEAGFLEQLFPHPRWRVCFVLSLLLFLASIITSVFAHTILLGQIESKGSRPYVGSMKAASNGVVLTYATWLAFIAGVLSFVMFTIRNLY